MADEKKDPGSKKDEPNGPSDEEVRKESSKVAKQATEAQDKATELMQAAAAAGDPEERQKLMEQALEQQIQSRSLGKTARYLRSGTFQGMAVGAGLGIAPGASLGAITGTLVGGVTSTALGGLGAGIGAVTGALHGPFWDLKKGAGKGIQKITGLLPGWEATEGQKKQLEKMVGQIDEQKAPTKDELENWGSESISGDQKEVLEKAKSSMPSMPSAGISDDSGKKGDASETTEGGNENSGEPKNTDSAKPNVGEEARKKPRKLNSAARTEDSTPDKPNSTKKQPRKLEKRSA